MNKYRARARLNYIRMMNAWGWGDSVRAWWALVELVEALQEELDGPKELEQET